MFSCSEAELRNIFSRFGTVQTCIVNKDKRHAFVKMLTRKDAVSAKENTEDNKSLEVPLRVSVHKNAGVELLQYSTITQSTY